MVLEEIIAKDPTGPKGVEAKGQLARLRLAEGRIDDATKLVTEILAANPKDMNATQLQGLIALEKQDGLKAVNDFRIITQDQPQNPEAWLLLARANLVNNEPEQAKDNAKKALTLKPDYQDARVFLYSLYLRAKDYDGAIETIKSYLRSNEKDISNLSLLGEAYLLKGDPGQAQSTFQKIVTLEPQNPLGYYKLGLLSRQQKQPDQALKYFGSALTQQPDYLPALRQIVAIHLEQKHPDAAMAAVRQALAQRPKNSPYHQMLGELLLLQKQPKEAETALEEAISLNPRNAQAVRLIIIAYLQQSDPEQADRQLEEKVANPAAPAYFSLVLATLYERQNKFDKAIDIYNTLLKKDLFPAITRNNLAYLLVEHSPTPENIERAAKLASEALEEYPDDPGILDTMGWVLCKKGDLARGKTYLEKATGASAKVTPMVNYHLGWCAAKLGDVATARESLQKALDFKGEFSMRAEAEKLLASLPAPSKAAK